MADSPPILVINPNSSERITSQIADAIGGRDVKVVRSPGGPPAIETDADVAASIDPLLTTAREHDAGVVVVACFSDPGLSELRRQLAVPAVGIAESAIEVALERGDKVGIISSVADSLPRHQRYWEDLGVAEKVIADVPLGLGVLELDTADAYERALAVGTDLVAAGADVVVLGCTGMTHMQERLQSALGVPVVDPCRAGVSRAREALAGSDR